MDRIREIQVELLDPSPFETREAINPLSSPEVLVPMIVRPKGERFEVVCGHRRLETYRSKGAVSARCEVRDLDDESAARLLYLENDDREGLSDYAKGRFFSEYMRRFGFGERELARKLEISHTTISLCLSVFRAAGKVVASATTHGAGLYESVVTTHKIKEVSKLPEAQKVEVLREVVEERLSTDETETVVSQVQAGQNVQDAVVAVVNERETRKPERYHAKQKGQTLVRCRVCRTVMHLSHGADGSHVLTGRDYERD